MKQEIDPLNLTDYVSQHRLIFILFALIIALFILGEILSKGFLEPDHVYAIFRTASFLGIVSIGQTMVILTGGIDLSVGSLITMGNVFSCMLINGENINTFWAILAVILLGMAFGYFNGFAVSYLKISPLVITLVIGSIVTGITLIISHGAPKGLASPILRFIGVGRFINIFPMIIIIWILFSIFTILLLNYSVLGRKIYYIGANEKAALFSGIKTNQLKSLVYSISGGTAALTGALMAGYTHTAFLGIGNEYVMWSIATVVIGGTSLAGGKGGYIGTIAGAVIFVLLESLLTVMNITEAGRRIANGAIILILVSIYYSQEK